MSTAKKKSKKTKAKTAKRAAKKRSAPASGAMMIAAATAQPSQTATKRARTVVAGVFKDRFGATNVPDDTKLSKFGLTAMKLAGIAANIRQRGIDVSNAAVQGCGTYGCIIIAAAAAV